MKKNVLFVFLLLAVLTISGCGDNDRKLGTLSAPQEVTVQSDGGKSLIIFDEVENAEYYNIYINDMAVTVKGNGSGTVQFDASKIITLPQKYTIKVKAGGEDYFESAFTEIYEYNHTGALQAPVVSLDGTMLNWDKVPNAEFYDVLVTTNNPTVETTHRFATNKFNFANILVNKGEYAFKVRAVSASDEYLPSIYSNQVTYIHTINLTTPYNLKTNYDLTSGEMLLTFVSSENVTDFTINIDSTNYNLSQNEVNEFLCADDLSNVYTLKLSSFVNSKNISISSSQILNISIRANASGQYVQSSQFSSTIACQFVSVLDTPQIAVSKTTTTCKINISSSSSQYLSGFAIYLNDKKYKTISSEVTQLELPLVQIGTSGIRVQAISNNNNCYSSNLSEVKYVDEGLSALDDISITFEQGVIEWNSVENATNYYVEVSNAIYKYATFITDTTLDLSTICNLNKYQVKVIAIADGYKQSENTIDIEHYTQLATIEDAIISSEGDSTYLNFTEVDGAYGYVLHINNVMDSKIYTSSHINLTSYISGAKTYNIQVQAISVANSAIANSEISGEQTLQNVITLKAPTLTIIKEGDKYYLNIDVDETQGTLASACEVWINYEYVGQEPFQDTKIDITSDFANAGEHHFMVKVKAVENNPYVKDSSIVSIKYTRNKQLDSVKDIKVSALSGEGTYILTFTQQELAAKYRVTIEKMDDENYYVEFQINSGVADISEYVKANGVYKVDVEAIPLEGSPYTESGASGNPYRLTKGQTLSAVENITITKRIGSTSNGEIDITWNKVENSSGYQVYVYYNQYGKSVLRKSVYVAQSNAPILNIGTGDYKCLNKEGLYTIQIKALGDSEAYVTSQIVSTPYTYTMQTATDFIRNTVFMYGNTYDYRVESIDDLKHLLWYHYLYNEDVWMYDTLEYNLKIYCNKDLDELANEISESFADQVLNLTTNAQKMSVIARELLKQYPEIGAWSLGAGDESKFCLNEEANVYIFRYENVLDDDKLKEVEPVTQVFNEKLDTVDTFDQRSTNYVFAIDNSDSIDVTTTEQLFMALQYNKRPNFVGDCGVAQAVYENARFVLRQICSDAMTDYEKTLQIYNFLTRRVTYNYPNVSIGDASVQVTISYGTTTMRGNIKDFYLEGILYNTASETGLYTSLDQFIGSSAVCDGLAKAFVVLCSIEGIDSIKVEGNTSAGGHAWNKVYLDIENDGYDGKLWYAIDLSSAILNSAQMGGESYQVSMHNYFLVADTVISAQATTWHKRLGDNTNYKATTSYDYYENERYSCQYNGNIIVSNSNLKAKTADDVKNALMYAMLKANKKHRVIVDIDASAYISSITGGSNTTEALASITSTITNTIYESARSTLGGQYNCQVTANIVNAKYIVLAVESVNYSTVYNV